MSPTHRGQSGLDAPHEQRGSVPPHLRAREVESSEADYAPTLAGRLKRRADRLSYVPPLAIVVALGAVLAIEGDRYALPRFQDDAYFYLEIARNIATSGRSDFTPGILTNGYQPLWMAVLVATGSMFGWNGSVLKALELVAFGVGLAAFVWLYRVERLGRAVLYTAVLWYVAGMFALNGMETSLLFPGLVVFVGAFVSRASFLERHRPLALFTAALFCAATRIDAVVLILPMLAVAPVSRRAKLLCFTGLTVAGLAYAGVNQLVFGASLPVSGLAKTLGGLQRNDAYLGQLVRALEPSRLSDKHSPLIPYVAGLATFVLAFTLRRRRGYPAIALALSGAAVFGLLLFGIKLAFFSSWVVWPWYGFPTAISALLALWMLDGVLPRSARVHTAMGAAGLVLAAFQLSPHLQYWPEGFPELNRTFIATHADALSGRTIAMGDRSGSFAFAYGGGVYQLEGLTNGASYLDVLERGGDLRPHLCERGIELLASYEDVAADYTSKRIEVLRPQVTSFSGPFIEVHRSEELARASRPARFDPPTTRLLVWRLRCR